MTTEQGTRKKRRWWTWIAWPLLFFILAVGGLYAYFFVRIVPPVSVAVSDAITGKPLSNMHVCMQAIATGLGFEQALRSELSTTNTNGRVFFFPSIHRMALLQSWYGYSIQVTDPKSHFIQTCGPQVGFKLGPSATEGADQFADARTDGSEHFPVELFEQAAVPKNISWFPFLRGTTFHSFMSVKLIPVLPDPGRCKPLADPGLLQDCTRLNTMAQDQLLRELLPTFLAGMERKEVQTIDDGSTGSGYRGYLTIYQFRTIPPVPGVVAIVEEFMDGRRASEHLCEIYRLIPGYDPAIVTEEEPVSGQKIKRIIAPTNSRAFWPSGNRLILLVFPARTVFEQMILQQWLTRDPSDLGQPAS